MNASNAKTIIRLLLVDDHLIVREGIRSCLAVYPQLEIVGEAGDGAGALEQARKLRPDVVLMDINLPGMNGLETTAILRQKMPEVQVIALTVHDRREYVLEIVRAGAKGYVLKDAAPAELLRAIETVHQGGAYLGPEVAKYLLEDYVTRAVGSLPATLSRRERDVLIQIAHGRSNKQIAGQFGVSVRTIETHRERIMRKLNIHSVAGLTRFAIERGLIALH